MAVTDSAFAALKSRVWTLEDWRAKVATPAVTAVTQLTQRVAADEDDIDGLAAQMALLEDRIIALETPAVVPPVIPPVIPPPVVEPPVVTPPVDVAFNLVEALRLAPVGSTVTMPAGIFYTPLLTLKSGVNVVGAGVGWTIISAEDSLMYPANAADITLSDFTLVGKSTFNHGLLVMSNAKAARLGMRRLDIGGFGSNAIFFAAGSNVDDLTLEDVHLHDCGNFGISDAGGGVNNRWVLRRVVAHGFPGRENPPHGIYLKNVNDLLLEQPEAYDIGYDRATDGLPAGGGASGIELDNCLAAKVVDGKAHDCWTGQKPNNGWGYIALGSTVVEYVRCTGGGNFRDFYECGLTGKATYTDCLTASSKTVYP